MRERLPPHVPPPVSPSQVASPAFHRDVATARAMADGRVAAYVGPGSGRIDDDVQLGYWFAHTRIGTCLGTGTSKSTCTCTCARTGICWCV